MEKSVNALFHGEKATSSLAFANYPALRDHPRHSTDLWLQGKRLDDGIDKNLWRVHDSLYDLNEFVAVHPGGRDWLDLTKGSDITEAFEAHHISLVPEKKLGEFFVRKIDKPRNSPFTFADDGFYRTLKRRVRSVLADLPVAPAKTSEHYADGLLLTYVTLSIMAARLNSWEVAIAAGLVLSMTIITAHNFFHRRDNLRMYYFDFSFMSSRGWRVSHVLSHHIYTNTVYDYEISFLEPFLQYLPVSKSLLVRYGPLFYAPLILISTFPVFYVRMLLQVCEDGWHTFRKEALLPWIVPVAMYCLSTANLIQIAILFSIIVFSGSALFSFVGINAAHHHPQIFHDGDKPRNKTLDWGLHQLDTVGDRTDINWSQFLILTNFGDHSLHHLFPTLDHGVLKYLMPTVMEVCKQFDTEIRMYTQLTLIQGQFAQLARQDRNEKSPPKNC